ncbi:MAG: rod shape-determining protein MreD [Flavobacteriaceae bacterium]|nr:rod shape-determining protein MreD [Flavobacteriaceae bacterium]
MNEIIKHIILFVVLFLLQVIVLNNVNFWGFINPMLYILFVFVYPFKKTKAEIMLLSFFMGLGIDLFLNSGGTNAAATLFIAYIRLPLLKALLRKTDIDLQVFNLSKLPFSKLLSFIIILTFSHHFIVFGLEYFKWSALGTILIRTFLTGIFTIILIIFSLLLMNKGK